MSAAPLVHQAALRVGETLRAQGLLLATAESCTGGMVSAALTDIAGSSGWFERGFVTYANQAKTDMLGVPPALLERHGAVSEPVARAMAEGALRHSCAQVSLAITGIAGPDGGAPDKPVGTVWFAWSDARHTHAERIIFQGNRAQVREQAAAHALRGVLNFVELGGRL